MERTLLALALIAAGYIAWRRGAFERLGFTPPIPPPPRLTRTGSVSTSSSVGLDIFSNWLPNVIPQPSSEPTARAYMPPATALPYLAAIRQAEAANGIPGDLLTRLLQQESNYRQEIITGRLSSRVGALGIAQVMPVTARDPGYGVPPLQNPLDPFKAIAWAGQYLAALRRRLGTWQKALAAYNFGPGNVLAGRAWPDETRNYVASITRDVPVA